jgi:hypothetical protein
MFSSYSILVHPKSIYFFGEFNISRRICFSITSDLPKGSNNLYTNPINFESDEIAEFLGRTYHFIVEKYAHIISIE